MREARCRNHVSGPLEIGRPSRRVSHCVLCSYVAGEPCSTEALTDLIYEGLAEPRLFGLGRGSRFGENWSVYFSESVTSGKLKGSHLFASVIHASRKRA